MEQTSENKNQPEIKLDRKSKIFFLVFALLIAGAVYASYLRYIVMRDYIIQAQVDCDPETENCFIWQCDPDATDEAEQCTGDPESDIWYYKIIKKNAQNIPMCDPNQEECAPLECVRGEQDCSYELCDLENVPESEECNDPEQYLLENPPEEVLCEEGDEDCEVPVEEEECAPDDEECLSAAEEEQVEECDPETEDCNADSGPAESESDSSEDSNQVPLFLEEAGEPEPM